MIRWMGNGLSGIYNEVMEGEMNGGFGGWDVICWVVGVEVIVRFD